MLQCLLFFNKTKDWLSRVSSEQLSTGSTFLKFANKPLIAIYILWLQLSLLAKAEF